MPKFHVFSVKASLSEPLKALEHLARNLWFSWHPEVTGLFKRLDPELWEKVSHNPIALLKKLSQEKVDFYSQDEGFLASLERVISDFNEYMSQTCDLTSEINSPEAARIAFFSAEYGLDASLPVYSGGMGVLAGDILKSASDLQIPMVGVGIIYRHGYFSQEITPEGNQVELYPKNDFSIMPVNAITGKDGNPIIIKIPVNKSDEIKAKLFKVMVGRVPLVLLDTDIKENPPYYREISHELYGGGEELRFLQEFILGYGGIVALSKLGYRFNVIHLNEGHTAFAPLSWIHHLMHRNGVSYNTAKEAVSASTVFTFHSASPTVDDTIKLELLEKNVRWFSEELGIDWQSFLKLGKNKSGEAFSMTVLGIKLSSFLCGITSQHLKVCKKNWNYLWHWLPEEDVPFEYINNGIHIPTWVSEEMANLFDRYIGTRRYTEPALNVLWQRVENVPDGELWRTHERDKEQLVSFVRRKLKSQLKRQNASAAEIEEAENVLNPNALTICFARRFAGYKRSSLIAQDEVRLLKILNNEDCPVQIIFSGKAHPMDKFGKKMIWDIYNLTKKQGFKGKIVFIEDYDINVAKEMLRGADIWLNTPRRYMEASGTSGMKSAANGGINIGTLTGWWEDGYNQENGWCIGAGEEYKDFEYQDTVESRSLYDILEKEVIPLFYQRSSDNLPRAWIRLIKNSIKSICPVFNTHRVLSDYVDKAYNPCARRWFNLTCNRMQESQSIVLWKQRLNTNWNYLKIIRISTEENQEITRFSSLPVDVEVQLGPLKPDDIKVELFYGPLDCNEEITKKSMITLEPLQSLEAKTYVYHGDVPCNDTGRFGFIVRVRPYHKDQENIMDMGLVLWS